jgi:hypothetical protein
MPRDEMRLDYAKKRRPKRESRVFDPRPDSYLDRRESRRYLNAFAAEQERLAENRRRIEQADELAAAVDEARRQRAISRHPSRTGKVE